MKRAIKESWIICEHAVDALQVRQSLNKGEYIIFFSSDEDNVVERLLSMDGIIFIPVGMFTKEVGRHAGIKQAMFILNPFDGYGQAWWDNIISEENQDSYVYGRNGKHGVCDLLDCDVDDTAIDKPKLFS